MSVQNSFRVGEEMGLRGRLPRIWALRRILRIVKSWNCLCVVDKGTVLVRVLAEIYSKGIIGEN